MQQMMEAIIRHVLEIDARRNNAIFCEPNLVDQPCADDAVLSRPLSLLD